MAQEIRLGSSESMKNINLGSTEIQEVYLGATLIWRNNVPPFYTVSVNGTVVSTNGTIIAPVKPPLPGVIPSNNFEYTSNISVGISNIEEEDQPTGNIIFNLYEGNYQEDDTLPVIDTFTTTQAGSGTLTIPKGQQPTGNAAANFLYDDRIFTITATDSEEGVSIQWLKITRIDSEDVKNFGGWVNSGGTYNPSTSTSTQSGLSYTINTQCFDATTSKITFNRTTTTPVANQNQVRTCAVQIVGIQDTPPKVCSTSDQNRTISVATGGSSVVDTTTGTSSYSNPSYVSGALPNNTVGGASCVATSPSYTNSCSPGSGCNSITAPNCSDGVNSVTTQPRCYDQNCAGSAFNFRDNGAASTRSSGTCSYPNSQYQQAAILSYSCGGASSSGLYFNVTATTNRGSFATNFANCQCQCANGDVVQNYTTIRTGSAAVTPASPSTSRRFAVCYGSCDSRGGAVSGTCTSSWGGFSC